MHDEFERALTGRRPRRMGPLGWVLAMVGVTMMAGAVGVAFAVNRASEKVAEMAGNFAVGGGVARLAALADLEAQTRLLALDPQEGLDFLDQLAGEDPADAFTGEMVRGALGDAGVDARIARDVAREVAREVRRDVRRDVRRSLRRELQVPPTPAVPEAPDAPRAERAPAAPEAPQAPAATRIRAGDVRIDLDRARNGSGSLVIEAGGEEVRFDLVRNGEGGFLSIDSRDGNVRFDLQKQGDGGRLLIESDEGRVRLGVGDGAEAMPSWVPAFGMPERPRPVYSLDSEAGFLGAVAWEADADPSDLLAGYREALEAEGYEIRDRYRLTGKGEDQASFWARNEADGRVVFLVAHHDGYGTDVLLGYGEER